MNKTAILKNWFVKNKKTVFITLAVFLLDRISKVIAVAALSKGPVDVFKYFSFHLVGNTGAAFGMFNNLNGLLIFLMAAVIAFIIYNWRDLAEMKAPFSYYGMCFILGGAFGNLYDRIFLGYVVDFLDFRVWPVFNLADSFVCVGAAFLFFALFSKRR